MTHGPSCTSTAASHLQLALAVFSNSEPPLCQRYSADISTLLLSSNRAGGPDEFQIMPSVAKTKDLLVLGLLAGGRTKTVLYYAVVSTAI